MQGSTLKLPLRRSLLLGRRLSRRHANRRAGGDPHPFRSHQSKAARAQFYDERTAALNAWLAPLSVRVELADDLTSVNTFRILFRGLFGTELPSLEKHLYFAWYTGPKTVVEITNEVDVAPEEPPPLQISSPAPPETASGSQAATPPE